MSGRPGARTGAMGERPGRRRCGPRTGWDCLGWRQAPVRGGARMPDGSRPAPGNGYRDQVVRPRRYSSTPPASRAALAAEAASAVSLPVSAI
ncbi:hypothetical protein GCM10010384_25360 [Streptomyces djakartensis]|uniref:Uncharacterized protein n=1 Tax=Streptomyces djakartensis TaxID=68193 RepID=A0ABQ2ZJE0_9ACTN|nr:hypothetical protein GCM10010384_25360 [Streptomyces djakartensis]